MKIKIKCTDGIVQTYNINPKNLKKIQERWEVVKILDRGAFHRRTPKNLNIRKDLGTSNG